MRVPGSQLVLCAGGLLWAAAVPVLASPPAPEPTLRTIEQIRGLSKEQAGRHLPVRIEAVVTYYHHDWEMLFVQSAAGAVFVYPDNKKPAFPIRLGDRVEIEGHTVPGDFIASIADPRVRFVSHVGVPAARLASPKDIASGALDAEWIGVRGVVRSATVSDDMLQLVVVTEGRRLHVHVKNFDEYLDPQHLVDAVVRASGVCTTLTDEQRQFKGAELWTPDFRDVTVEQPAPGDPFAANALAIGDVHRNVFAGTAERRLKVTGTVALQQPGSGVFIQDENDGLFVQSAQRLQLEPGDRIEASGFLGTGGRPSLEEAVIRRVAQGPPPVAPAVTAEQALKGAHDARLIRIRGRFVGRLWSSGQEALMLQDGTIMFDARLGIERPHEALAALEPGSLVEVVGVCSLAAPESRTVQALQVLLRSPQDLLVLERASWWTATRVRRLLEIMTVVFVGALSWAAMLRRTVRRQTEVIRQRLEREAALEQRFSLAIQGTNDGVWDWDLQTNRVFYSPRWKAMLGYAETEIGDTADEWLRLAHVEDRPRLQARLDAHRSGSTPQFEDEHRLLHRDGTYRWVLSRGFASRDPTGRAYRMTGAQTDVTDRRFYDPLTGLPNRALFAERLERAVSRSRHPDAALFAVLFLDLDRFKVVNDSLGHLSGDRLLEGFAGRIEDCVRPGDMVARFGGDEFAILLTDISAGNDAAHIAERIHKALEPPFNLGGHEVYTSASIGIALSSTGYEHAPDVLRDADTAMYRAKAKGRARFEVFDTAMRERVTAFMRTENDLRRAIERGELRLHYQPIVALADRQILAFEALVRWQHPERGLLSPEHFVEVAEETGLIVPIGEWVLHRACRDARSWPVGRNGQKPSVCVNLSACQVSDADVVTRVCGALQESGIPPEQLVLEMTESAIMETGGSALARLATLKALGLRLHLDDFGTGYSSLSYLHRFPIEALKIDRSFIAALARSEDALAIVRSILSLCQNLRLTAIAEGVESAEQAQLLAGLGCGQAQGFHFSPAVELERAVALLASPERLLQGRCSVPNPDHGIA
jgi:diguanylate cyclase (GGDEF)-like protein/PAS domain S-box-containing protein